MRIAHLDCPSGISGDMLLGALVDAGAPMESLQDTMERLGVGPVRLAWAKVKRNGLSASFIRVHVPPELPPMRNLADVRRILDKAELPPRIRHNALGAFTKLAEAEAAVHDMAIEDIHFHEVGALDTLADIIGACVGFDALGIDRVTVGPVSCGQGEVRTSHGVLPLPVPAVAELLKGFELRGLDIDQELITPTGAALLAQFATSVPAAPAMIIETTGSGAGSRDLPGHANILRVLIGQATDGPAHQGALPELAVMLEATIDDLSPELIPVVLDSLRDAGAHDTWATAVLMKKGRPGYTLHVLCDEDDLPALRTILYRESSTIGSRWYRVERETLPREWINVEVDGEQIRVKVAEHEGQIVTAAPEFGDVRAAAEATGRPARAVYADATAKAQELLSKRPGTED